MRSEGRGDKTKVCALSGSRLGAFANRWPLAPTQVGLESGEAAKRLQRSTQTGHRLLMGLPPQPITIAPEEVAQLNLKLATARHNINNHLALIVAAVELIRRKPDLAPKFLESIATQPERVIEELKKFSEELERILKITRDLPNSAASAPET